MQFLNVFFGGRLVQDLPTQLPGALNHKTGTHPVTLVDGTLFRLLGTDHLSVNTYHHQGVTEATLAPVFDVAALSDSDRVVEGVRHRAHCVFGIQWHPERPNSAVEADLALMHSFMAGIVEHLPMRWRRLNPLPAAPSSGTHPILVAVYWGRLAPRHQPRARFRGRACTSCGGWWHFIRRSGP
jgi:hypothetical protein